MGNVQQKREGTQVFGEVQIMRNLTLINELKVTKSANYTITLADSGYIIDVDTDAVVLTLPSTVLGLTIKVRNIAADGAAKVSISPNAADKIQGAGLTAADNKDLINTKATAKYGDFVTLIGDGVDGWLVQEMKGTWAREA